MLQHLGSESLSVFCLQHQSGSDAEAKFQCLRDADLCLETELAVIGLQLPLDRGGAPFPADMEKQPAPYW